MAVTDTPHAPPTGAPSGGAARTATHTPPAKKGNWFQQHKAIAIVGGAGVAILLLSHKGASSSSTDADTAAQDAAAEQAAIDQAVGDQTGNAATDPGTSSDPGGGGSDPSGGSGSGGSNGGGGDGQDPGGTGSADPSGTGGVTINEGNTKVTVNTPGGTPSAKALPSQATVNKDVTGLQKVTKAATGGTGKVIPKITPAKKSKPAPKTPPKPTKPPSKTKGSVLKHGRAFPGAISCHVGMGHTSSDGVLHEPITVNYGGYSETHMSHNRGQSWTDRVPGYTPPSRGVPLVRLGTPEVLGADWNQN